MDFYRSYQRFISEMGNSLNDSQRRYLEEMKASYAFIKTHHDTANHVLEGLEQQQISHEREVQELTKRKNVLSADIRAMSAADEALNVKLQKLNKKKKAVEKEISTLEASYKSKAIGKGIYEKKYRDAIDLISEIHEYTAANRCKTKEALEKNIRLKAETSIQICDSCGRSENHCRCATFN